MPKYLLVIAFYSIIFGDLYSADVLPSVLSRVRESTYKIEARCLDRVVGTGTAFAVEDRTTLITAHHCLYGATSLVITNLSDGLIYEVSVIEALDRRMDLARIKIKRPGPNNLDSEAAPVAQGQGILIYGNPIGLNASLGMGIVASVDPDRYGLIQLGASVSPGFSGGPVITYDGKVLGIVVSKIANGGVEGIGFAVPINRALMAPRLDVSVHHAGLVLIPDYRLLLAGHRIPKTLATYDCSIQKSLSEIISFDSYGLIEKQSVYRSNTPNPTFSVTYRYDEFGIPFECTVKKEGEIDRTVPLAKLIKEARESWLYNNIFLHNLNEGKLPEDKELGYGLLCNAWDLGESISLHLGCITDTHRVKLPNGGIYMQIDCYGDGIRLDQVHMNFQPLASPSPTMTATQYHLLYNRDAQGNWIKSFLCPGIRKPLSDPWVQGEPTNGKPELSREIDYY